MGSNAEMNEVIVKLRAEVQKRKAAKQVLND